VLVETLVFAPLGAALLLREHLPSLTTQGRQHAENRIRVARMVGEFAVKAGKKELERRLASRPSAAASTTGSASSASASAATDAANVDADTASATAATAATADVAPGVTSVVERPLADDLPIPGYDSLAASQVVERLSSLNTEELELVRRYEAGGRHRRTILHRIDQLAV
jgi:hypothetical protein